MASLGNITANENFVQAPFIIVKIGDYTFGNYGAINSPYSTTVTYPKFMKSLKVTKVNGTVNSYTINMSYQIQAGEDPNLLEKVFSKIGFGNIYITYGDCTSPTTIFKEEKALITKVTSTVNFQGSRIDYVITAVGASITANAAKYFFPGGVKKPSDVIKQLLRENKGNIKQLFSGMDESAITKYIASDDKPVRLIGQYNMSTLDYLNYLVENMTSLSNTDSDKKLVQDSSYFLTVNDAAGGSTFAVTKIGGKINDLNSLDTFIVDVGYPSDNNPVLNFTINNNESWSIFYNYANQINQSNYVYTVDNDGMMTTSYSPSIARNSTLATTTEKNKNWWTKVTQYPITATLTLKGLVRPQMLMSYILVNAYFYGRKHDSSGVYAITKQEDSIDRTGYKTTLTLLRVRGDSEAYDNTVIQKNAGISSYFYNQVKNSGVASGGFEQGENYAKEFFQNDVEAARDGKITVAQRHNLNLLNSYKKTSTQLGPLSDEDVEFYIDSESIGAVDVIKKDGTSQGVYQQEQGMENSPMAGIIQGNTK